MLAAELTTADPVQVLGGGVEGKHPNEINTVTGNTASKVHDARLIPVTVLSKSPALGPMKADACAAIRRGQLHSHICSVALALPERGHRDLSQRKRHKEQRNRLGAGQFAGMPKHIPEQRFSGSLPRLGSSPKRWPGRTPKQFCFISPLCISAPRLQFLQIHQKAKTPKPAGLSSAALQLPAKQGVFQAP